MSERKLRIVDLSVPLMNHSLYETNPPVIHYTDHRAMARRHFRVNNIRPEDFGVGAFADEVVTASTHTGTHIDAPYHFGPLSGQGPAKTIDDVPLEWCYGDGVRLDFRHKQTDELISPAHLEEALAKIGHSLKPYDIVMIWTGVQERLGQEPNFWELHPGMSPEATEWLIDRGIKLMGSDAWGWDVPYHAMFANYRAGRPNALWPSLMVGRRKEFGLLLKLSNLEVLPAPTGFKVAAFPVKIERGSSGWVRAAAIIET